MKLLVILSFAMFMPGCKPKDFVPVYNTAYKKNLLMNYDRASRRLTIKNADPNQGAELHLFSPFKTASTFVGHEEKIRQCAGILSFGDYLNISPMKWIDIVSNSVGDVQSMDQCEPPRTNRLKYEVSLPLDGFEQAGVNYKAYQGEGRKFIMLRLRRGNDFDDNGRDLILFDFTVGTEKKCILSFKEEGMETLVNKLIAVRDEYISCVIDGKFHPKQQTQSSSSPPISIAPN